MQKKPEWPYLLRKQLIFFTIIFDLIFRPQGLCCCHPRLYVSG
ncbi:MAG: hypothetical protein RLZZ612_1932 [Pseudomonadota bacterium]|jgi:hypothetical protein